MCVLGGTCSDLKRKSFSKTGFNYGFPNCILSPKSKAIFSFLSFISRNSTPMVLLYAGYSASQLAVFQFISTQWYLTKILPFLVASSDLQLAGAIQTAFMWHGGFSLIWFPRLDSAGCGRFYELIPVPHFSAVTH